MVRTRWAVAIPAAFLFIGTSAWGSAIRDDAKMFSPNVVEEAQRRLDRLEKSTGIPVVIETVDHVPGIEKSMPKGEKYDAMNHEAARRDQKIHDEGIYILISKGDHLISQPLIRKRIQTIVPPSKQAEIRTAFTDEFNRRDIDGGLKKGIETIERTLDGHRVGQPRAGARVGLPAPVGPGAGHAGGGSTMGTFLLIGAGILAVLLFLRVLGALFGRSSGAGYPSGPMGGPRPGMGPGPGPGYGGGYGGPGYGGGYGGRGGGFFSGLLGGLGGAMAGNWLYDQMSGRHGEHTASTYPTDTNAGVPGQDDDAIIGADSGQGGSWDDGGGDTGGDWGGGDSGGGGGDWGGGGGDWGGGGDGGGGGDW